MLKEAISVSIIYSGYNLKGQKENLFQMTCSVYICVQTTELHRCTVLGETEPSG